MAATAPACSSVLLLDLTGAVIAVMVVGALELVSRTRWQTTTHLVATFSPPVGFVPLASNVLTAPKEVGTAGPR